MVALLLTPQVRTTGVNLEGVLAIVLPVIGTIIAVGGYINSRTARREDRREKFLQSIQENTQKEITSAVNHLSEVLLERLETKQAVNELKITIASLQTEVRDLKNGQRPQ